VFRGEWRDENGCRHRRVLASDRRVAEQMLDRIIAERDRRVAAGVVAGSEDLAVPELLLRYVEDRSATWRPSTARSAAAVTKRLAKEFADVRCDALTAPQMYERAARRRRDGAAHRTINLEVGILRAALRWAVRRQLLAFDPLVSFQRLPEGPAHEKRPRREFSEDEARRFLAAAAALDAERASFHAAERTIRHGTKGRPFAASVRPLRVPQAAMWRTLLCTGIRWGEMAAVTWSDVELEAKLLRLRAATTKTKRARSIPLVDDVVAALRELQVRTRAALGRELEPADFVFLTPMGEPWAGVHNNAQRAFHEVLRRAGIVKRDVHGRSATIHGLRHTFVTMLARARVPLIEAQHLAGHSDPRLTAARYTHLHAEDLRSAVDKLPRFDGGAGATERREGYSAAASRWPAASRTGTDLRAM
jgi:integrase